MSLCGDIPHHSWPLELCRYPRVPLSCDLSDERLCIPQLLVIIQQYSDIAERALFNIYNAVKKWRTAHQIAHHAVKAESKLRTILRWRKASQCMCPTIPPRSSWGKSSNCSRTLNIIVLAICHQVNWILLAMISVGCCAKGSGYWT